ncbi:MAG: hypothetical protein U1F77_04515 [Kiritimatiellia bacterium]
MLVPDLQTIEESGELMVFDLDFLQKLGLCPLLLLRSRRAPACATCWTSTATP